MARLRSIHFGQVQAEEFLKPMGISAYRFAKEAGIPETLLSQIIKAKRRVTADTALRLSKYFGTTAQFWLGLQVDHDLEEEQRRIGDELSRITTVRAL